MGVHGLWRLLDSFGQVARPEDWAGRRVAIDASIWIAQFRAKTEIGEDVERRVLVGFFARILKLLFYNIEAVFVFDGPATTLKTAEQRRRGQRREAVAQAFLRRRARQIMMAQIAAGVLDVSALPQQRKRGNKNKHSELPAETDKSGGEEEDEGSDDEEEDGEDNDGDEEGQSNSDEDDVASSSSGSSSSSQQQQQEQQTATSHTDTSEHAETHDGSHTATQQVTKRRRHRHHRRALAPAKVSAALTANFLDRAREQLSEYEKGEQRLMYNLLRHSSTSLFMGPRRVIAEANGGQSDSTHDASATSASAPLHKKAKQEPTSSAVVDVDSVSEVSAGSEDAEVQLVHTSSAKAARQRNGSADTTKDKVGVSVASPSITPAATTTLSGLVPAQVVHALYQRPQHTPSPSRNNNNTTISLTSPVVKATGRVATKKRAASSTSPSPSQPHSKGGKVGSQTVDLVTQDSAKAAHSVSSSSSSLSWASVGEDEMRRGDALAHDNHDLRLTGSSVERGMTGDAEDDVFDSDDEEEEEEEEEERNGELLWAPGTQGLPLPRESRSPSHEPAAPGQQHSPLDSTHVAAAAGHVKVCNASDAKVEKVMKADDEEDYTPVKGFAPTSLVLAGTTITSSSPQPSAPAASASSAAVQAPNFFASVVHHGEATRRAAVLPPELTDIVLLLESCGLSYVVSPAESDAQCAFLARHGLVDAVFTEDSDVVVHGSPVVLRGFFSTAQQVVEYRQSELAACGMDKRVLVALAMLLGCDYVEGVPGMGLVSALDAIAVGWDAKEDTAKTRSVGEGSDDDVLQAEVDAVWRVLTRWRTLVTQPPRSWLDADDTLTLQQFQLLDHYRLHWAAPALRPSFPERRVIEAFYTAAVDDDKRPFPPLVVEWNRLRLFAGSRGLFADGWLAQRFELARRECERRAAAAAAAKATADPTQRKLTDYGIGHQVRERWAFKKLHVTYANALSHLRAARHMTVIEDTPTRPGNEEEEVAVVKTTRKQKAPAAKRAATRRKAAPRKTK